MTDEKPSGPDLAQGVTISQFEDDKLLGHVGQEAVLLVRRADQIFAIGALCTHYHGPLAEGLVTGGAIHCPWHHACFDLATGEALQAPAIDPLSCWNVEQRGGKIFVGEKRDTAAEIRACGLGVFLVHIGYPRFSNLTPKPPEREID